MAVEATYYTPPQLVDGCDSQALRLCICVQLAGRREDETCRYLLQHCISCERYARNHEGPRKRQNSVLGLLVSNMIAAMVWKLIIPPERYGSVLGAT
jgi:hypothetical protein